MLIVRLVGGLGNQLFQIAAALAFAKRSGNALAVDKGAYDHDSQHGGYRLCYMSFPSFQDDVKSPSRALVRLVDKFPSLSLLHPRYVHERYFSYRRVTGGDKYLIGYWQDSSYFDVLFYELLSFIVPREIPNSFLELQGAVLAENSVSVHIRRGDYLDKAVLDNHGICSIGYYRKAIQYIKNNIDSPVFYLFTNDQDWAVSQIAPMLEGERFTVVTGGSPELDLWLMSKCKNAIIANSSFSWWGAYLARHASQVVISPDPWYEKGQRSSRDPSLTGWVRISKQG